MRLAAVGYRTGSDSDRILHSTSDLDVSQDNFWTKLRAWIRSLPLSVL